MLEVQASLDPPRKERKLRLPNTIDLPLKEKLEGNDWFALGRAFTFNNRYGCSSHLGYIDLIDYNLGANFALWIFDERVVVYPYPPVKSSAKRYFLKLLKKTLRNKLQLSEEERNEIIVSRMRNR